MIKDEVYELIVNYIDLLAKEYGIEYSIDVDEYNNLVLVDLSFYSPPLYYTTSKLKKWVDILATLEEDLEYDVKDIEPDCYIDLYIYRVTGDGFNIGIKVE